MCPPKMSHGNHRNVRCCPSGLTENGGLHPSFSRHGKIKASFILHTGLTKTVDCILRFLAMAELKRAFILLIWLNENDEKQRGPLPSNWTVFRQVFDGFPSFSRSSFVLLSFEIRSILVRFSIGSRSVFDRLTNKQRETNERRTRT